MRLVITIGANTFLFDGDASVLDSSPFVKAAWTAVNTTGAAEGTVLQGIAKTINESADKLEAAETAAGKIGT